MPKATLFEADVYPVKDYMELNGFHYKDEDGDVGYDGYDETKLISSGMTFTMNYTHTRNYASEDACTTVKVISIRSIIDDYYQGPIMLGCQLQVEEPIFICISSAYLGRPITLHTETTTIAKGYVKQIIEPEFSPARPFPLKTGSHISCSSPI